MYIVVGSLTTIDIIYLDSYIGSSYVSTANFRLTKRLHIDALIPALVLSTYCTTSDSFSLDHSSSMISVTPPGLMDFIALFCTPVSLRIGGGNSLFIPQTRGNVGTLLGSSV
jgi:hypothetical protein